MLVGPATICVYAFSGGRWVSLVFQHLLPRNFLLSRQVVYERKPIALNFWALLQGQRVLSVVKTLPCRRCLCYAFGFCSDNRCTIKSLKMEKPCDKKRTGHALRKQADWTRWPPPWPLQQASFSSLRGFVSICRFVPRISRSCLAFGFPCKFWKDRSHRSRTEEGKAGKVKPQAESVLVFLLHVILKWHLCIEKDEDMHKRLEFSVSLEYLPFLNALRSTLCYVSHTLSAGETWRATIYI